MKKKALAALLSASMVMATLAGCGSTSTEAPAESPAADTGAQSEAASEAAGTQAAESTAADTASTDTAAEGEAASVVTEPTELTLIFADGDEGFKQVVNDVVEKFNAAYPDITITIEPGNGGAYSEFLKTKDSVGEFPDVMEMRDTAGVCPCRKAGASFGGNPFPVQFHNGI